MKRFAVFVAVLGLLMFAYWLTGEDFSRSPMLARWFIGSVGFAAVVSALPII